jgi:hypothetical protein
MALFIILILFSARSVGQQALENLQFVIRQWL